MQGEPKFIPCTPLGCLKILDYYKIETKSKNVVVIGRSNLVGKPIAFTYVTKFFIWKWNRNALSF